MLDEENKSEAVDKESEVVVVLPNESVSDKESEVVVVLPNESVSDTISFSLCVVCRLLTLLLLFCVVVAVSDCDGCKNFKNSMRLVSVVSVELPRRPLNNQKTDVNHLPKVEGVDLTGKEGILEVFLKCVANCWKSSVVRMMRHRVRVPWTSKARVGEELELREPAVPIILIP